MRTIGVVTVSRSDYSVYLPLLRRIQGEPSLKLHLIVAGMHWLKKYGETVNEIREDSLTIGAKVEPPLDNDSPRGISEAIGVAVSGYARSFAQVRPDLLVVLGDRFEMHAAALAALSFKIPVAHIHGGELTLGAIDNALRHSITHLAHLHFVATEEYGRRVIQLGEEPWRVVVSGAPAIDLLQGLPRTEKEELASPPLLVTFHPVTLEHEKTSWHIEQLLEALETFDLPIIFTAPNADTGNSVIWNQIEAFVGSHPNARLTINFGPKNFFSMLALAAAMIGNSSSGLIEAPSFRLPVVNIGTRQEGRIRAKNVIDVGYSRDEIRAGIRKALSPDFRESLADLKNPYGDGRASERIVNTLKTVPLDQKLVVKRFVDQPTLS
jgi:UDP-hydrolysing UDP-N-acetyl-D-glucosamine 2-epimerase